MVTNHITSHSYRHNVGCCCDNFLHHIEMVQFIDRISKGRIVVVVVKGSVSMMLQVFAPILLLHIIFMHKLPLLLPPVFLLATAR